MEPDSFTCYAFGQIIVFMKRIEVNIRLKKVPEFTKHTTNSFLLGVQQRFPHYSAVFSNVTIIDLLSNVYAGTVRIMH